MQTERAVGGAGADHRVGHRQRVDEARTHGLHIEGWAAGNAQLALDDGGRGRKHHVRRGCGDDDQVDVLGLAASGLQRMACGADTQVAGRLLRRREMARANARALDDPVVRGLDAARGQFGRQVGVGDTARRQRTAGAGDAGVALRIHASRSEWVRQRRRPKGPASPPGSRRCGHAPDQAVDCEPHHKRGPGHCRRRRRRPSRGS